MKKIIVCGLIISILSLCTGCGHNEYDGTWIDQENEVILTINGKQALIKDNASGKETEYIADQDYAVNNLLKLSKAGEDDIMCTANESLDILDCGSSYYFEKE